MARLINQQQQAAISSTVGINCCHCQSSKIRILLSVLWLVVHRASKSAKLFC